MFTDMWVVNLDSYKRHDIRLESGKSKTTLILQLSGSYCTLSMYIRETRKQRDFKTKFNPGKTPIPINIESYFFPAYTGKIIFLLFKFLPPCHAI